MNSVKSLLQEINKKGQKMFMVLISIITSVIVLTIVFTIILNILLTIVNVNGKLVEFVGNILIILLIYVVISNNLEISSTTKKCSEGITIKKTKINYLGFKDIIYEVEKTKTQQKEKQ